MAKNTNDRAPDPARRGLLLGAAAGLTAQAWVRPARAEAAPQSGPFDVYRDLTLDNDLTLSEGHTVIENCLIVGRRIRLSGTASLTLRDCEIRGVKESALEIASTGRVQVSNTAFDDCAGAAIRCTIDPTSGANVLIEGNDFRNVALAIDARAADTIQVFDNRSENATRAFLRLGEAQNAIVSGNHCYGAAKDGQIVLGPSSKGVVIAQNYFANGISGVVVEKDGHDTATQITLLGNRFQDFSREAVVLGGTSIAAHNIFDGCEAWGLWLRDGARNVQIADNLFLSVRYGLGLPAAAPAQAVVTGNRFHNVEMPIATRGKGGAAVALSAGHPHTISGTLIEPVDSP